jgi:hypothetical protein
MVDPKLLNKTYICVVRELPAKDPNDEKEQVETVEIGLLINNDDVDWDKYEGEREVKVTFMSEQEKKSWIPFVKAKKKKVEKTVDAKRHTKNADLKLTNVQKQDVVDAALATVGKPGDLPLVIEVYHDVGAYDLEDLQLALSTRAIHHKMFPDLKIMGYTKEVAGNNVVFTGEIIPD